MKVYMNQVSAKNYWAANALSKLTVEQLQEMGYAEKSSTQELPMFVQFQSRIECDASLFVCITESEYEFFEAADVAAAAVHVCKHRVCSNELQNAAMSYLAEYDRDQMIELVMIEINETN